MEISASQDQLKDVIKSALVEVLQERQDLLHDAIEQALEDFALVKAIEDGEQTSLVERSEVFAILEAES